MNILPNAMHICVLWGQFDCLITRCFIIIVVIILVVIIIVVIIIVVIIIVVIGIM